MVTLYDVNENDATLSVLEGSYKYHNDFFNKKKEKENITIKSDWYKLDESKNESQYFINKGCKQKCVLASKGSLILWNSKTFHQGTEANKERNNPNFRLVVYICMTPRDLATESYINKKNLHLKIKEQQIIGHIDQNYFQKPLPNIKKLDKPILTDFGKRIAGLI